MSKSNEPLVWLPFFAGAGLSAFLMPILIILTLFAGQGGLLEHDLRGFLNAWIVRVVLFALISLSLFHAAHRIRFILVDLGMKAAKGLIAKVCYGFAILGTLVALLVVTRILQ